MRQRPRISRGNSARNRIEGKPCERAGREFSQSIFFPRKWRWDKCRRGYQAFKRIMGESAQGVSNEKDAASGG